MDEKETICQIRLFTSGLCEVEFSVEIGCREVAVTKCPAPYKKDRRWPVGNLACGSEEDPDIGLKGRARS